MLGSVMKYLHVSDIGIPIPVLPKLVFRKYFTIGITGFSKKSTSKYRNILNI